MRQEFDVAGFIDEMRTQDIVNRLVGSIADSHRKTPMDCFSQEDITSFLAQIPRDLRKYGGRIPFVKRRYGGDKYDFVLPFKESDAFDPDQKIVDIFNPEKASLSDMDPIEIADNSVRQLFNQTGRPQGLVIATESLTGLIGQYYVRSYSWNGGAEDELFRNVREGSIGYHPNVHFGLDNPRDTTLGSFVQLVASAIVYHEL